MVWTIGLIVAGLALWHCCTGIVRSNGRHLPRDFDFDIYKNRELNQRGLFDKTKWY